MAFVRNSLALLLICAAVASAQVPVVNGGGKSLRDLAGSDSYVTIVLDANAARVFNVRIKSLNSAHGTISTEDVNGKPGAFRLDDIREVRVQPGKVQAPTVEFTVGGALRKDDQELAVRAVDRAVAVFSNNTNQDLRMKAASLASVGGRQDAVSYLASRLGANDVDTAVEASLFMYLAGEELELDIMEKGLVSGNLQIRGLAAKLVGLSASSRFNEQISAMLEDTAVEVWPRAAIAAGRLQIPSAIPKLVRGLGSLDSEKSSAATLGLILLGGDAVVDAVRPLAESESQGNEWFRAVRVLYALDDPRGKELMKSCLRKPGFATEAAIILTPTGDWDATQYLRDLLSKLRDPNERNLIEEARAAIALYEGGIVQAKNRLQEMLRMTPDEIYLGSSDGGEAQQEQVISLLRTTICLLIAQSGNRSLISLSAPILESGDPRVTLAACDAITSATDPVYRERLLAFLNEPESAERYP